MADEKKAAPKKKVGDTKAGDADSTKSAQPTQDEKTMAIVAWFLFFVPLLTEQKDSKFVKFHVNQSLNLVLLSVASYVVASMLMVVLIGFLLIPLVGIGVFVLWIIGLLSAINGETKKLPVIGEIELIK